MQNNTRDTFFITAITIMRHMKTSSGAHAPSVPP